MAGLLVIHNADDITPENLMHNFYFLDDYLSAIASDPLLASKLASNEDFLNALTEMLSNDTVLFIPNLVNELLTRNNFFEQLMNEFLTQNLFYINLTNELVNNNDFFEGLSEVLGDNLDILKGIAEYLGKDTTGVNLDNNAHVVVTPFSVTNIEVDISVERTKKSSSDKLTEDTIGSEWHIIFDDSTHYKVYRIDQGETWDSAPTQAYLDEHYAGSGEKDKLFTSMQYLDVTTCNYKSYGNGLVDYTTGVIYSSLASKQSGWIEEYIVSFKITDSYTAGDHFIIQTFNRDNTKYGFIANLGIYFANYDYFKDELVKFLLKYLDSMVGVFPYAEKVSSIIKTSKIGGDQKQSVAESGSTQTYIIDTTLNIYPNAYFDGYGIKVDFDATTSEIKKIISFESSTGKLTLDSGLSADPTGKSYTLYYWYKDEDELDIKLNNRIDKNIIEGEIQLYTGSDRDNDLLHPFLVSSIEIIPLIETTLSHTTITSHDDSPCRLTLGNLTDEEFDNIPLNISINLTNGGPLAYITEKNTTTKEVYLSVLPTDDSPANNWDEFGWTEPVDNTSVIYFRETLNESAEYFYGLFEDSNYSKMVYLQEHIYGALSDIRYFWYYGINYGKIYFKLENLTSDITSYYIRIKGIYLADLSTIENDLLHSIAQIKGVSDSNWNEDVPYERSLKGLDDRVGNISLEDSLYYQIAQFGEIRLKQYRSEFTYNSNGDIEQILVYNTKLTPEKKAYEYSFTYNSSGDIERTEMKVYDIYETLVRTVREDYTYNSNGDIEQIVRTQI